MFSVQIDRAIIEIAKGILDNVEIPLDHGLYVRTRVRVKKPESKSHGKGGFLHFVFQRPWHGTYVSVWFQRGDDKGFIPDDTLWDNTANHDSEWRSDGVRDPIATAYFDYCAKVDPRQAPISLESTADIDHIAIVEIKVKNEPDGYHRTLVGMVR